MAESEKEVIGLKNKLPFLVISFIILGLDQLTKQIIQESMFIYQSREIIGNFLKFSFVKNPNSVFGLYLGGPAVSTVLTILAFIFVLFLFFTAENRFFIIGISMIIGGAMGNIMDRFLHFKVIDFIDVGIGKYRWPTFNVADSFVTIGILFIIAYYFFIEDKNADSSADTV